MANATSNISHNSQKGCDIKGKLKVISFHKKLWFYLCEVDWSSSGFFLLIAGNIWRDFLPMSYLSTLDHLPDLGLSKLPAQTIESFLLNIYVDFKIIRLWESQKLKCFNVGKLFMVASPGLPTPCCKAHNRTGYHILPSRSRQHLFHRLSARKRFTVM